MARDRYVQYVSFYTAGSAALKMEPAVRKAELPAPKKAKRVKVYIEPLCYLALAVCLCMLIAMFAGVAQLKEEREKTAQAQMYVELLRQENESLQVKFAEGYDLADVESTALAMGMIPAEQAPRTSIQLSPVKQEQTVTLWQRIGAFLSTVAESGR